MNTMNHLLRKTLNKEPDSERLLSPRKSLFGKKRGTRSEDEGDREYQPPPTSSDLNNNHKKSVFKPTLKQQEKEVAPPRLKPLTPKTTPPSPDSNENNNNSKGGVLVMTEGMDASAGGHGTDGEETVMSDLTGTIVPPPAAESAPSTPNHKATTNNEQPTDRATTPPHGSAGSYCSEYSPSLEVFQKPLKDNSNTNNNNDESHHSSTDNGDNNNNVHHEVQERNIYCESSVLESMLGVVDGACHRGLARMGVVTSKEKELTVEQVKEPGRPLWGMAPSEDEDDSTRGEGSTRGPETTVDTTARDTYHTGDTTTNFSKSQAKHSTSASTGMEDNNEDDTTDQPTTGSTARNSHYPLAKSQLSNITEEEQQPPASSAADVSTDHHENYELVLGQTDVSTGEADHANAKQDNDGKGSSNSKEAKKDNNNADSERKSILQMAKDANTSQKLKGWVSRHLSPKRTRPDDADEAVNENQEATKVMQPITVAELRKLEQAKEEHAKEELAKEEQEKLQQTARKLPVAGDGKPPPSPSNKTTASSPREELYQSVFGDEPPRDGRDVGVEIQNKRVQDRPFTPSRARGGSVSSGRSRSSRSSTPSKLSGVFKKIKKSVKRHKSSNEVSTKNVHFPNKAVEPSWLHKQAGEPENSQPNQENASPSSPTLRKHPPKGTKPRPQRGAEEEKKEIEPQDAPTLGHGGDIAMKHRFPKTAESSQLADSEAAAALDDKNTTRKFIVLDKPEINGIPLKPITETVRGLGGVSVASHDPRPKAQGFEEGVSETAEDSINSAANLSRLRSAPTTLSNAELAIQKLMPPPKLDWKTAKDDKGRTYYYHRGTRNTTWEKPDGFDEQVAAVLKYKEEMDKAKKAAEERQQVIDGCKNIQALRKTSKRDFDPTVWETKQKIMDIVKTIPLPTGTNIEKLLVQYDGREEQLLANLRDLVESKPFDEPFQAPSTGGSGAAEATKQAVGEAQGDASGANNSFLTASSQSSTANYSTVDVHSRVRTAVSASTRFSEKTNFTEKTEKIRNTGLSAPGSGIGTIREIGMSTGSISSAASSPSRVEDSFPSYPASGRVPSNIPAVPRSPARSVPRSRDLKVEVFAREGISKETYNDALLVVPPSTGSSKPPIAPQVNTTTSAHMRSVSPDPPEGTRGKALVGSLRAAANGAPVHHAANYAPETDDDSYNGDYDDTVDDTAASEKIADSISALSETDVDYAAQRESFEKARRRALDVAVQREDWDLAAALSEGMKQVKHSLYSKSEQKEWTQTELDRFISENDWDAVSRYIAHMRDHPGASTTNSKSSAVHTIPGMSSKNPSRSSGRDPEGSVASEAPPAYVSEATKRASQHTQSGRRQVAASQASSTSSRNQPAQKRFGARSQLQHQDLNSISSWDDNSTQSSYDSEFTDGSYESDDEQGYISLRVRRNEFQC